MEPLQKQFDVNHLKIEPKLKISVRDSMFKGMAVEEQHKFIIDLLPEDFRNHVIIESSALPEESIDYELSTKFL
uniref:Uncharacterized protein n=1 Tax=Acrobeloides nanus TaxID=290746 RepID=A0A914E9M5_9BILA